MVTTLEVMFIWLVADAVLRKQPWRLYFLGFGKPGC